jgi:hypothetical protein
MEETFQDHFMTEDGISPTFKMKLIKRIQRSGGRKGCFGGHKLKEFSAGAMVAVLAEGAWLCGQDKHMNRLLFYE